MGCHDGSCCGRGAKEGAIYFPGTDDHDTPWKFYNHLIAGIPEDIQMVRCCLGTSWTYVEAECGMGVAMTCSGGAPRQFKTDLNKLTLREVAELSKSWNFGEATLGVAALNAWYAQPDKLEEMGVIYDPTGFDENGKRRKSDIFEVYRDKVVDKNVTVIGHFPNVERVGEVAAKLTVLERNCSSIIDTPDPGCEYILPKQDFVFITGVTIINKTAPRLFELCKKPFVTMSGPSVVPAPFLYKWGVDCLAGSVVIDPEETRRMIEQGTGMLFGGGIRMFRAEKPQEG